MGKCRIGLNIDISGRLITTVAKGEKCMTDATPTELIDNERVKVTEWKFKPGQSTGWHRHGMDYVVIPVTTGKLLMKDSDGERTVDLINGKPTSVKRESSMTLLTQVQRMRLFLSK